MTHKYLLHVFRLSTNPPRKALTKQKKSAKKWNESKRPKNTLGKTLSRSFRVKFDFSPPCCNKDGHSIKRGICCFNIQTVSSLTDLERFKERTMSETMTENNSLNLTAKCHWFTFFFLHSVNQRAVRLYDMWQNHFKVNQSTLLNEQVND